MTHHATGVVSPSCRENNLVKSKKGALVVLKALLGKPIDADLLEENENPSPHETVVAADPVRSIEGIQIEEAD